LMAFSSNLIVPRNSQDIFYLGAAIKGQLSGNHFGDGDGDISHTFLDIDHVGEWYDYMMTVTAASLWPGYNSYDGDSTYPTADVPASKLITPGTLNGFNYLLGAVRFGQLRAKPIDCLNERTIRFTDKNLTCYGSGRLYSMNLQSSLDTRNYGYNLSYPFEYDRVEDKESISYRSPTSIVTYAPPTYNVFIPSNASYEEVIATLQNMRDHKWIDMSTAAVFADFNFFNPTVGMVVTFRMIMELMPSGGVYPNTETYIQNVFDVFYKDTMSLISDIVVVLLNTFFVITSCRAVIKTARRKKSVYAALTEGASFYVDCIQFYLIYTYYIQRYRAYQVIESQNLKNFEANPTEFYYYRPIMLNLTFGVNMASVAVFIAWMKLFQYLSILPPFKLMIDTLDRSRTSMLYFIW
jgi:hypothetical protein